MRQTYNKSLRTSSPYEPIVAAHHRESLVPASILMAMIGYALGNYLAILTGRLGQLLVS